MTKHFTIVALLAFSGLAQAGNYATCLLDKLPGLQNDQAAAAAIQVCSSQHPGGMEQIAQGEKRGVFGYESGAECALKNAGETRSSTAAYQIRLACDRLYDKQCSPLAKEFGLSCN